MTETQKYTEDPVCMMVIEAPSDYEMKYEGETYHFCSKACKDQFGADPKAYTNVKSAA